MTSWNVLLFQSQKNCPNKDQRKQKCAKCRGPHVANHRGCPAYKDQAFRQHVVQNQVSYASILKQGPPPPPPPPRPKNTFNFTAEKIVSLVTNVVIQITQPQLYTKNMPEKTSTGKFRSVIADRRKSKKCLGLILKAKICLSPSFLGHLHSPSALCLQLHDGREKENSSDSFYGLKNKAVLSLPWSSSHSTNSTKKPYSRLPT